MLCRGWTRWLLAACLIATALTAQAASDRAASASSPILRLDELGFLGGCAVHRSDRAKDRCYVRRLLAYVESSRDPATELPRIDRRVRAGGGYLAANCHMLMHEVGRTYARSHRLTLATLQRHVPRSNDPGCSAGFGMGLIMYLGPQILEFGGRGAIRTCLRLPTRFRTYTCIHGLGHAYMRAYHGHLEDAVAACVRGGRPHMVDCAQGAFHDYWISLRGADGTTRPKEGETSPRSLCDGGLKFVRPCWYRFFLERQPVPRVTGPEDMLSLCRGTRRLQRSGCISAASLIVRSSPPAQARLCGRLRASDAISCLRGVRVQDLPARPGAQLGLIRLCRTMPASGRRGCYEWFGRTLAVVTNGAFRVRGCSTLAPRRARAACSAGARRMNDALVTFS